MALNGYTSSMQLVLVGAISWIRPAIEWDQLAWDQLAYSRTLISKARPVTRIPGPGRGCRQERRFRLAKSSIVLWSILFDLALDPMLWLRRGMRLGHARCL
jgi:hypothetical protein